MKNFTEEKLTRVKNLIIQLRTLRDEIVATQLLDPTKTLQYQQMLKTVKEFAKIMYEEPDPTLLS